MPLRPIADPLASRLLDLVFPPRCAGCGARGSVLCADCLARVRAPGAPTCAGCDRPLGDDAAEAGTGLCARCQARGHVPLAGWRVAALYADPIRAALWALKYHGQHRVAGPLGDLLAQACKTVVAAHGVGLVIPVPLHISREHQRGYNQARLLAGRCAARLGLPLRADLLARTRATPPQVRLSAAERRANVSGAFAVTPAARATLAGRVVLLVDDVRTTGATLAAAAEPLHAAGARAVWALTVARPALGSDGAPDSGQPD